MELIWILFYFILFFVVVLSFYIYIKSIDKKIRLSFLFLGLSIAVWIFSAFLSQIIKDYNKALWLVRIAFSATSLIGLSIFLFSYYFPSVEKKYSKNKLRLIIIIGIFFMFFCLTPFFIERIELKDWGANVIPGKFYILFTLYFLIYILSALYNLYKKYKLYKGIRKIQIKFVFIGLVISITLASSTNLIMPLITQTNEFAKYGPFFTIFLLMSIAYSILAHRLFDIRVIVKKTFIYSAILSFIFGIYILVVFSFTKLFGKKIEQTMIPGLIAALFIALGFDPLKRFISQVTEKYLFKNEYNQQEILDRLSKVLSSVLDLDEAMQAIINIIASEMKIERAATFILTQDPENKNLYVKRTQNIGYDNQKITLASRGHLVEYFNNYIESQKKQKNKTFFIEKQDDEFKKTKLIVLDNAKIELKPIVTDELERILNLYPKNDGLLKGTVNELKKLKIALAIPIIVKGNLIGILTLGYKKSGDIFNGSDLVLFNIIVNQIASSIEKARFYEEDQLKSEFVSIASHELLTPTSAIEGYLSMILDEGYGKIDKKARVYLEKVYLSSKRLAKLVKDLLNVSRIEGGRILIQSNNFDIKKIIKSAVEEIMPKLKEKNLDLKIEGIDRVLPEVWADPERVHQVLVNLLSNAIKYTSKGTITIMVDYSLSTVRVSIEDTGIGIAKDEIPHLFEKFYRAYNADSGGAQGTGLGLYITKRIIELMGGIITLDSELGKGTTVSFTLPKAKENK